MRSRTPDPLESWPAMLRDPDRSDTNGGARRHLRPDALTLELAAARAADVTPTPQEAPHG